MTRRHKSQTLLVLCSFFLIVFFQNCGGGLQVVGPDSLDSDPRNGPEGEPVETKCSQTTTNPTILTDGIVKSMAYSGSTAYISGEFSHVQGVSRSNLAAVNRFTGKVLPFNPKIAGSVAALQVMNGKLYVGGNFHAVGGIISAGTMINPDGKVNLNSPEITDGEVFVSISDGAGGWFIGGNFRFVSGVERRGLARILADGRVHSWNPGSNYRDYYREDGTITEGAIRPAIYSLLLDGTTLYVGGSFHSIGNAPREYLGSLSINSNLATSWNPQVNRYVRTMAQQNRTLYIGGDFTVVGSETRNRVAAFDLSLNSNSPNSWNPNASETVNAILYHQGTVYVAGPKTVGAALRRGLAAVDPVDGSVRPWIPDAYHDTGGVKVLAASGNLLFVGGSLMTTSGGNNFTGLVALDTTRDTNNLTSWNPNVAGRIHALALNGNILYAAGSFHQVSGVQQSGVAALDISVMDHPLMTWNSKVYGAGWINSLSVSNGVVFSGNYPSISMGGVLRTGLVALHLESGLPTAWDPKLNGEITALAQKGSTLFVAGDFSLIGGLTRTRLAALDTKKEIDFVMPWNASTNYKVLTMSLINNSLYVGGQFQVVNGVRRNNIVALDATSGQLLDWDPRADGSVVSLVNDGHTLYAGGPFNNIGGVLRRGLAALDPSAQTNMTKEWDPHPDGNVLSLALADKYLYVGGSFSNIGGASKVALARLDTSINVNMTTAWTSGYDLKYINTVFLSKSGHLLYSGNLKHANGFSPGQHIASFGCEIEP